MQRQSTGGHSDPRYIWHSTSLLARWHGQANSLMGPKRLLSEQIWNFLGQSCLLFRCREPSHKYGSCDHVGLRHMIMSCRHLLLFSENLDQDGGLGLVVVDHLHLLPHPPPPHHHRCALLLLCGQGGPITVKVSPNSLSFKFSSN